MRTEPSGREEEPRQADGLSRQVRPLGPVAAAAWAAFVDFLGARKAVVLADSLVQLADVLVEHGRVRMASLFDRHNSDAAVPDATIKDDEASDRSKPSPQTSAVVKPVRTDYRQLEELIEEEANLRRLIELKGGSIQFHWGPPDGFSEVADEEGDD